MSDVIDLDSMHPRLRENRESTRTLVAYVAVYDNGDIKASISDEIETQEQCKWALDSLDLGREEINEIVRGVKDE